MFEGKNILDRLNIFLRWRQETHGNDDFFHKYALYLIFTSVHLVALV